MNDVIVDGRFGDYRTKELLGESLSIRTWMAEQVSVGRMVLLEELKVEAVDERVSFLADVRVKAAVEHPLVGSIYEAFTDESLCFYTEELLPGTTLDRRFAVGEVFEPLLFVHILRCIAETNEYHESHGNETSAFDPRAVYLDEQGVVRIKNLAISGERLAGRSEGDILKLGSELGPMVKLDCPGIRRCLTLLAWMRGEEVERPLTWTEIRNYCEEIEGQLTEPLAVETRPMAGIKLRRRMNSFLWVVVGFLVLGMFAVFLMPKKKRPEVVEVGEIRWVNVKKGNFTTSSGFRFRVNPFQISAREVTIGEYAEFLGVLANLGEEDRSIYDHNYQPEDKSGHEPSDWEALFAAAKEGASWGGYEVGLELPVVGVDWWDAYAYAKWKKGFLPNQEQWMGALMGKTKVPSGIPVSDWLPVTENTLDRTNDGIEGLAGSVAEWTNEPRINPSNPLGDVLWVIVGGSYLQPAEGAVTRVWVDDRSLRRADLGFRIGRKLE